MAPERRPLLPEAAERQEETMSDPHYWVVGGEYRSLSFDKIVDGTQRLLGPFTERDEAERTWRHVSEQHRSRCLVRFTIAQEGR
jgi:hypothetical protein